MSRRVHLMLVMVIAALGVVSLGAQSSCSGSMPLKHAGEPCTRERVVVVCGVIANASRRCN